jgi:hypothetical protein
MPSIQLAPHATPRQFEFKQAADAKNKKQLREDALHLRPGATTDVTDDELAYIKENDKPLAKLIKVIGESKKPKDKPTPPAVTPTSAAEEAAATKAAKAASEAQEKADAAAKLSKKAEPQPAVEAAPAEAPVEASKDSKKKGSPSA